MGPEGLCSLKELTVCEWWGFTQNCPSSCQVPSPPKTAHC